MRTLLDVLAVAGGVIIGSALVTLLYDRAVHRAGRR